MKKNLIPQSDAQSFLKMNYMTRKMADGIIFNNYKYFMSYIKKQM